MQNIAPQAAQGETQAAAPTASGKVQASAKRIGISFDMTPS
jgi:hypothetical protein